MLTLLPRPDNAASEGEASIELADALSRSYQALRLSRAGKAPGLAINPPEPCQTALCRPLLRAPPAAAPVPAPCGGRVAVPPDCDSEARRDEQGSRLSHTVESATKDLRPGCCDGARARCD